MAESRGRCTRGPSRTRRAGVGAALALLTLVAAPPASAGTYSVSACDAAPGGRNNSWYAREDRGMLAQTACPSRRDSRRGLVVRNRVNSGTVRYRRGAFMAFEPPAGARLTGIRFDWDGHRVSRDWTIGLTTGGGRLIAGCPGRHAGTPGRCQLGDPKGARRRYRDLGRARKVRIEASCAARAGCETRSTRSGDRTRAQLAVHDPTVVVADRSAPSAAAGGSLLGRGWQRGRRIATVRARDNVGILSTTLRVDGRVREHDRSRCDFTRRRPCPPTVRRRHPLQTLTLPDGRHGVTLTATDAAGNARRIERSVLVDNHAPRRVRRVRLLGAQGVRSRNSFDLRWTPPPGQAAPIAGARYRLCRVSATRRCVERTRRGAVKGVNDVSVPSRGSWRFRVWLFDRARNASRRHVSAPVRLEFDQRSLTHLRGRVVHDGRSSRRATVGFGAKPLIRGALTGRRGRPVAGARLEISERVSGSERVRRAGSARTDAAGRFRFRAGRGPSRKLRLEYRGDRRHRGSRAAVRLAVRARSSIAVSRKRVANGGRVRFRGRLRGGWVPAEGKLIQLEAYYRDRWRTFEVLRTASDGRWRHPYRFEATSGRVTYPFRVRIPRDRGYPYAVGRSRVVRVTVEG